ncbi:MAG: DNA polymerase III subunit gamma/tau [Alphaproteobacteria bacterium]|nr:DNA polymerase III subunit gamma/tau [Alphaproteobacteria bacterium]
MVLVYRVLARKYRPKTLGDLVGQEVLTKALAQGIENDRLPHAFLLHGIRGVGKTTTARIIARALNCIGQDGKGGMTADPCGVCVSCISINDDRHLDVIEIDAASRTSVDDIREIIESCRYKAVTGRYKIFIIDEVHMLSKSAFNALLKTLEEPPAHVKFIFATTEIRKIPDTIISRCMRFDLKRIEPLQIIQHLQDISTREGFKIEQEALASLARTADGSMRDGLSLLDQAIALTVGTGSDLISATTVKTMLGLCDRQGLFSLVRHLFTGDVDNTLKEVRLLVGNGGDPSVILQDILDMLYWLTCLKSVPQLQNDPTWPEADRTEGVQIVAPLEMPTLIRAWQLLLKGLEEVNSAPIPAQALEMVLLRFCYMADMPPLQSILESFKKNLTSGHSTPRGSQVAAAPPEKMDTDPIVLPPSPIAHPVVPLPATFADLIKMLELAREPLLVGHITHDLHLIDYKPGELSICLGPQAPASFISQLSQVLKQQTQHVWKINLGQSKDHKNLALTLAEQKQEQKNALSNEALTHPVIYSLKQSFPGSTVTFME